jgi:hypothetical protein
MQKGDRRMFVEFERDAPKGQSNGVSVNVDSIWHVATGVASGLGGQPTTRIFFNNGQQFDVIGDMPSVVKMLRPRP